MKELHKAASVLSLIVLSAACAPRMALKPDAVSIMENSGTIHVIRSMPADFNMVTAAGVGTMAALGPILGTLVGGKYAEKLAGDPTVDPAARIQAALAKSLKKKPALRNIDIDVVTALVDIEPDDYASLNTRFGGKVVMGVTTKAWGLIYLPLNWGRYRLNYGATATLADPSSGKKLWQQSCSYLESSGTASSRDELTVNDAALLKRKLALAADECLKQLPLW